MHASPRFQGRFQEKFPVRVLVLGAVCAGGTHAAAQLVPYAGFDRVQTASTAGAVNALAAEAQWLNDAAAAGPIHVVDMESMTAGASGRMHTIAPGVTMGVRGGYHPDSLTVESGSSAQYGSLRGFNSTLGGMNHMSYASGDVFAPPQVFLTFAQPIQALSLFITGEGLASLFVAGSGSTRIFANGRPVVGFGDLGNPYWPSTAQPDVRFGGFIDPSAAFTSVMIELKSYSSGLPWRGSYSLDDIRWVPSVVPGPGVLAVLGAAGAVVGRRRREE